MVKNPYIGLRPFKREDNHLFFGREKCVNELYELLGETNFFAVIGEAYCGKSSLIGCGLESKLLENKDSNNILKWHIVNFRPDEKPFSQLTDGLLKPEALGNLLLEHFESEKAARLYLKQNLSQSSTSLHQLLELKPLPKGHKLLLICDQFEDVFHLWHTENKQSKENKENKKKTLDFVDFLIDSSKPHPLKGQSSHDIHVILTMRSAYLDKCTLFPKLANAIKTSIYLTPRLDKKQLQEIILNPLNLVEIPEQKVETLTEKLEEKLLNPTKTHDRIELKNEENIDYLLGNLTDEETEKKEEHNNPKTTETKEHKYIDKKLIDHLLEVEKIDARQDQLPLLQHLLMRMWTLATTSSHPYLSLELYQKNKITGLIEALNIHLDDIYLSLKDDQFGIAEILFRQLSNIKDASRPRLMHTPIRLEKVCELAECTTEEVICVIEAFRTPTAQFLLPAYPAELHNETLIEISHESIVRHWKKLHEWKHKEHQAENNYKLLDSRAKKDKPVLLKGLELQNLLDWSKEHLNEHWANYYGCNYKAISNYLRKSKEFQILTRTVVISVSLLFTVLIGTNWFKNASENTQKQQVLSVLTHLNDALITKENSQNITQQFKQLLNVENANGYGWYFYGLGLMQQEQWEDAISALEKAHNLKTKNPMILYHLGLAQQHHKQYEAANKSFEASLKIAPEEIKTLIALGDNLTFQKEYTSARTIYQKALAIKSENALVLGKIAQVEAQQNNYQQAIQYFKQALSHNSDNEGNWRNLGITYRKKQNFEAAVTALNEALRINGRNDENWLQLGIVLTKQNKLTNAIQVLNTACKLNPDKDKNWANLGHALMKSKNLEQARKAYQKAININPSRENFNYLAELQAAQNNYPEAIDNYRKALSVTPKTDWE